MIGFFLFILAPSLTAALLLRPTRFRGIAALPPILFMVFLLLHLLAWAAISSNAFRLADADANMKFYFLTGMSSVILAGVGASAFSDRRERIIATIPGVMAMVMALGQAIIFGLVYFASMDEFCMDETVARLRIRGFEVRADLKTCDGAQGSLRVRQRRPLPGGVFLVRDLYKEEYVDRYDPPAVRLEYHPPDRVAVVVDHAVEATLTVSE